nr:retrovirus-related Pol polyprotein from transposon TNT 1-94 [Tanacetum cinerariifolium]
QDEGASGSSRVSGYVGGRRQVPKGHEGGVSFLIFKGLGVKVDDEDQALILLCSLPGSDENFVDTMLYGRITISVNDVKDAFLSKKLKIKVSRDEGSGSDLFAGRGRSQERNNRNERKKEIQRVESSNSGSVAVVQDGSDDEDFGDVLMVCSASIVDTWIMDTGASHRMTFSRDLFTSFKEWNGTVKLGDDAVLSLKGSGIVQIKMHDGIVRKFDCWFVPGLKKNLISFGTLAKNGLKYHGKQVKTLRTDNGLEFCNTPFDNFYKKEGIMRHHTVRHTLQQNGVVERMNQTLLAPARSPSTAIGLKMPQEVWFGKPSDYSDLRIFGCPTYAHVNDGVRKMSSHKFDLEKFNGSNDFTLWKVKMRAIQVHQGCVVTLEGEDKFPKDTKEKVKKDMARAHSAILLSVTDEVFREVVDQTTAFELWDKLLSFLIFKGLGVKVDDEDQALILLCSLPGSDENFVDTMLYGRITISVNDVKDAFLSKKLKRKVSRDEGSGSEIVHRKREIQRVESSNNGSVAVVQDGSDDGDFGDVLMVCSASIVDTWIMDTGASHRMTFSRDLFTSFKEWNGIVKLGDDGVLSIKGSGIVQIKMHDGIVRKFDCWFVPGLKKNLISLGTLAKNGLKYHGKGEWVKVSKGALVLMKGKLQHGIYFLQGTSVIGTAAVYQSSDKRDDRTNLWHRRLGHMSKIQFYEACVMGKQRRVKFSIGHHTSKEILEYIHSDLWGPSSVKLQGGYVYFVTFIDDYSRKVYVYFLKTKDEVFGKFKE